MSQLPFGFRTNWDKLAEILSDCPAISGVSIAFRLSDELGRLRARLHLLHEEGGSQLPFGFRTNWDREDKPLFVFTAGEWGTQLPFSLRTDWDSIDLRLNSLEYLAGLNCLSAFGRIGTGFQRRAPSRRTQGGLNCLSAFGRIGT